jgi:hypothetical protein
MHVPEDLKKIIDKIDNGEIIRIFIKRYTTKIFVNLIK